MAEIFMKFEYLFQELVIAINMLQHDISYYEHGKLIAKETFDSMAEAQAHVQRLAKETAMDQVLVNNMNQFGAMLAGINK